MPHVVAVAMSAVMLGRLGAVCRTARNMIASKQLAETTACAQSLDCRSADPRRATASPCSLVVALGPWRIAHRQMVAITSTRSDGRAHSHARLRDVATNRDMARSGEGADAAKQPAEPALRIIKLGQRSADAACVRQRSIAAVDVVLAVALVVPAFRVMMPCAQRSGCGQRGSAG